jgi:hypothetical protein
MKNMKTRNVMVKMTEHEFHKLKGKAYAELKNVSQFIREQLCQ